MKKTYQQIQAQIESLRREAETLRKAEVAGVISRIKEAVAAYGLTAADLGLTASATKQRKARAAKTPSAAPSKKRAKPSTPARKVAPKYRDEAGNTWTGRGNQPRWLRQALTTGRSLEEFKI